MAQQLDIWTSQIAYRQRGNELVVNSTAGSGTGVGDVFSPGWELVMASKRGEISWEEYTERYIALLREKWQTHRSAFEEVCKAGEIVLVCYCGRKKAGKKCHRYLLADALLKAAATFGIEATYRGEVMTYGNRYEAFDKAK